MLYLTTVYEERQVQYKSIIKLLMNIKDVNDTKPSVCKIICSVRENQWIFYNILVVGGMLI